MPFAFGDDPSRLRERPRIVEDPFGEPHVLAGATDLTLMPVDRRVLPGADLRFVLRKVRPDPLDVAAEIVGHVLRGRDDALRGPPDDLTAGAAPDPTDP
jgi:hypothetical protein